MCAFRLEYHPRDGYVDNWLVAGPRAVPILDLSDLSEGEDLKIQVARANHTEFSDIHEPPVDRGSFQIGEREYRWRYVRCLDDHLVDLSTTYPSCHYLRSWAYAQVALPAAQKATFVLSTHGPADVWVNSEHVHRQEHFEEQDPQSVAFQGVLLGGVNEILVRFEQVALRECPYAMSLQIRGLPVSEHVEECGIPWSDGEVFAPATGGEEVTWDETRVLVPTDSAYTLRRLVLERVFDQAYVEGFVHHKGNRILLHWAPDLETRLHYTGQIQDAQNRIYVEALPEAEPGRTADLGHPARLWEGAYDVVVRARPEEYYEHNMRYERRMPIHVLDNPYSSELYGTLEQRRTEALEHGAKRGEDVYGEIAKMSLGQWSEVDAGRIRTAIESVERREVGSALHLLGLLDVMVRYAEDPSFPQDLLQPIQESILGYRYWHDEPGQDAMWFVAESQSILYHTCQILAGQLYPKHTFANAGQTGRWHREKGEQLVLGWLYRRGTEGFAEWDSNACFAMDLVALSHLADLSENSAVRELAAVVMDKTLLTIALNSFKGVFGSTHGRTETAMVLSGQLEATSGITRLLWGMGVWNHHVAGTVSLACSEYEVPLIIPDIAVNLAEELWNREQHPGVNKVTYRTPDYMLCSAQDHRPGERGSEEHIWQATLDPDAIVFVNHPACMSESDARRPNFWRGNRRLPRVAQWKETLVALYDLGDEEAQGFTHAYFPTPAFDEYRLRDGWAFARKGRAYVGLRAAQGLDLVTRGRSAYRELRSYGRYNAWLCLLGRPNTDGSYEDFQRKVRALDVELTASAVRCTTLRGQRLSFSWEGPLVVGGEEQPLAGFKHYENPYCSAELPTNEMEVRTPDFLMRLRFHI